MPLYDYVCEKCDFKFTEFIRFADRNNMKCHHCGEKATKLISDRINSAVDSEQRDLLGTPVWFPKNKSSYYDRFLGKTFHSKAEKVKYMNEKRLVMDGSNNPKEWPVEAGDMRKKSYRKQMNMDD